MEITNMDWPFPNFKHAQKLWKMRSSVTILMVGVCGRAVMHLMNRTKIYNEEIMLKAIFNRPAGTPLITVSNHESCWDDPMVISTFFKSRQFLDSDKMRWSLAAKDICFEKSWHGVAFAHGKCIPVVRGNGVYQRAVDFALDRVNTGEWLHIFPEGKINMEREKLHRLKWGVGRIISECTKRPIVIPFWHTGMANILPNQPPYYPRINKSVIINVGHPLEMENVLDQVENIASVQRRKIITDFIQDELTKLREKTLKITSINNDLVESKNN